MRDAALGASLDKTKRETWIRFTKMKARGNETIQSVRDPAQPVWREGAGAAAAGPRPSALAGPSREASNKDAAGPRMPVLAPVVRACATRACALSAVR